MTAGIEAISAYVGRAYVDVGELFAHRALSMARFDNLMMREKSVNLPCEDAVTNAVNAARPLLADLPPAERDRIELLAVGTESGLDLGKPISTYIHHYLDLPARCRSFEVKHACYGGTAALQCAAAIIAASPMPGARALVVAADVPSGTARGSYWEPSEGAGAVAMLVSREPRVLRLDPGASGFHTYEVMDTARPGPGLDLVDPDVSLLAYLSCLERSFAAYRERVAGIDIMTTFDHLLFHTPFAGMVKGAHRTLLRKLRRQLPPSAVDDDFEARVASSLEYPSRVGNLFSAALYLALCSLLESTATDRDRRVGLFSYGSGCGSEFYSGVIPAGAVTGSGKAVASALDERQRLSVADYDRLTEGNAESGFGVREARFEPAAYAPLYDTHFAGRDQLVLDRIREFHREYRWT